MPTGGDDAQVRQPTGDVVKEAADRRIGLGEVVVVKDEDAGVAVQRRYRDPAHEGDIDARQ